jgi:nicotinate dehydrogenase subunit A
MVTLLVNGVSRTLDVDPETPLLYVLRNDLDLHGPRFGCGLAQCGACTVLMDGVAIRSCATPVSRVERRNITTLWGLNTSIKLPSGGEIGLYQPTHPTALAAREP